METRTGGSDDAFAIAARALAAGDPLGALQVVALRDEAQALALRGAAFAQLGDLPRAADLLNRALRKFGRGDELARARCVLAAAEVGLARRELRPLRSLALARATLVRHGDAFNARYASWLDARRALLCGELATCQQRLDAVDLAGAPARLIAAVALCRAELAVRRVDSEAAQRALSVAARAAERAAIPALQAEVQQAQTKLALPVAHELFPQAGRPLELAAVERLVRSDALPVDGCRREVRVASRRVPLARRPVLFALAQALAVAGSGGATRAALVSAAFGARRMNDSHRARLRVEIARLRRLLHGLVLITATDSGFVWRPVEARRCVVWAPPVAGDAGAVLGLLADGEAWSTTSVALALDRSQRSVQRALRALEDDGAVRALGRGRARRWLAAPLAGIATTLLLPGAAEGA